MANSPPRNRKHLKQEEGGEPRWKNVEELMEVVKRRPDTGVEALQDFLEEVQG